MELVILMGLQGSGKSSFARARFFDSHVRLNLDMLKTRHRERLLFEACLAAKAAVLIDNTNPSPAARARYIAPASAAGFTITGYYLRSTLSECLARNAARARVVPEAALKATLHQLKRPHRDEGFDALYYVQAQSPQGPADDLGFSVQEWSDEV
ncbi:AAA family ATPase [Myxococcota bacterium]|nr:AAA family ATPase [Myxococcota bacterium]